MNKWIGSGKVTEEPVIRYNGDKASFVAFTMMCKRNRRIKEGDQPVDFIDCVCVGQNAKLAQEFLRKGKKVEVCGPLQSGHYEKNGRKVYTKTVFVEDLLNPSMTLMQNADWYGKYYSHYSRECMQDYLSRFHLEKERRYGRLSKGEKLKCQFAFALSHDAKLLILDEPAGNF